MFSSGAKLRQSPKAPTPKTPAVSNAVSNLPEVYPYNLGRLVAENKEPNTTSLGISASLSTKPSPGLLLASPTAENTAALFINLFAAFAKSAPFNPSTPVSFVAKFSINF